MRTCPQLMNYYVISIVVIVAFRMLRKRWCFFRVEFAFSYDRSPPPGSHPQKLPEGLGTRGKSVQGPPFSLLFPAITPSCLFPRVRDATCDTHSQRCMMSRESCLPRAGKRCGDFLLCRFVLKRPETPTPGFLVHFVLLCFFFFFFYI